MVVVVVARSSSSPSWWWWWRSIAPQHPVPRSNILRRRVELSRTHDHHHHHHHDDNCVLAHDYHHLAVAVVVENVGDFDIDFHREDEVGLEVECDWVAKPSQSPSMSNDN